VVPNRQNLVGFRVKQARLSSKPAVTQEELSRRLSKLGVRIDRAGVAKVEAGIRGVLDFEVVALAKALEVTTAWLLGETKQ
jgi:HTH-type transcriptional regulator, cell division transcriptional repressor